MDCFGRTTAAAAATATTTTTATTTYHHHHNHHRQPNRDEMHAVFAMCRQNQWNSVLNSIRSHPLIPLTTMIMDNHISTTVLHQAITSKGDAKARARVIREILTIAPNAARIKNGYGSLPLHVIAQRNTKMDAPTKELLISDLVHAYKGAIIEEGGVGKRTPLHIIFTDYISPRLTKMMIENGMQACYKRDKKGYLPVHVACSRHCSPEKLSMLLKANPSSLTARTNDGDTLLSLAISTATKSHPNYALIDELKRHLDLEMTTTTKLIDGQTPPLPLSLSPVHHITPTSQIYINNNNNVVNRMIVPIKSSSNEEDVSNNNCYPQDVVSPVVSVDHDNKSNIQAYRHRRAIAVTPPVHDKKNKRRKTLPTSTTRITKHKPVTATTRKRKVMTVDDADDPANLLLHFSRYQGDKRIKQFAKV